MRILLPLKTIAIHTLGVLVYRWSFRPVVAIVVILAIWIFVALTVGISPAIHEGQNYYGDVGYCEWT